jgi:hypothetical protein
VFVKPAQVRELPRAGGMGVIGIATIVVFLIAAGVVPVMLLLL